MAKNLKELNKENKYTAKQLQNLKKFQDKFLNVYPLHYDYYEDGKGYITVYEVRGTSTEVRENFQTVSEILSN